LEGETPKRPYLEGQGKADQESFITKNHRVRKSTIATRKNGKRPSTLLPHQREGKKKSAFRTEAQGSEKKGKGGIPALFGAVTEQGRAAFNSSEVTWEPRLCASCMKLGREELRRASSHLHQGKIEEAHLER